MHIAKFARERERTTRAPTNFQGSFQQVYVCQEMARPILSIQTPPPRMLSVRYLEAEYQETSRELARPHKYYLERAQEWPK